jgi:23S rRNA (uracil1939-C5)-methyltransferase
VNPTVRVHGIAAGGDGVATLPDGRVVFIPRAATGDELVLREVTLRGRHARARIARILQPSADRVAPACPHYEADDCGGCQLQHLNPAAQREARRRMVGDALRRIGRLEADDPPLEPADTDWHYRTRITLAVQRPPGRREPPVIGFHPIGRADRVFDLGECWIARAELNALWAGIRERRGLLPRLADRVELRVDRSGGRHVIVRTTGTGGWTGLKELGRALAGEQPVCLWWHPEGGAPRVVAGSDDPYPATVFEQVHPAMGDRVREYAVGELGYLAGQPAWDLYAGIGDTSRLLLQAGAGTVESVERDPRAVQLAEARGPAGPITRHTGRVEDLLGRLRPAAGAIVNPPRTGLALEVTRFLANPEADAASLGPDRLVYVSCDPATLARDLARLAPRYRVIRVRAFDAFPQTAHVETVATLERA